MCVQVSESLFDVLLTSSATNPFKSLQVQSDRHTTQPQLDHAASYTYIYLPLVDVAQSLL